jgi:hypothetical protein
MQRAVAQDAAEGALATPVAARVDSDFADDVVFLVVDPEGERAVEVLVDELGEGGLGV